MTQGTQVDLEEAAFQAELANESIDVSAPLAEETKPAAEAVDDGDQVQPEEIKPERVEVIPGYTKEELDSVLTEVPKLRSALEKTNGTYGSRLAEQQKIIDELRARTTQQQTQEPISLKQQIKLKRLSEEFPEIARILAEDLSEEVTTQQRGDFDPSAIEEAINNKLDAERQARASEMMKREIKLLKREHPDFESLAAYKRTENGLVQWVNPAFGNWVAAQPKETQDIVIASMDASDLSDVLTNYKNSLKAIKKNRTTTNNLENAIQPKGLPSSRSVDHLDDEDRAFHEELSKEDY